MKATVQNIKGEYHYFDKNGVELKEGDVVKFDDGRAEKLYLTDQGELGTDATSKAWLESGRAFPCEYGIYPLFKQDMPEIEKIEKH